MLFFHAFFLVYSYQRNAFIKKTNYQLISDPMQYPLLIVHDSLGDILSLAPSLMVYLESIRSYKNRGTRLDITYEGFVSSLF